MKTGSELLKESKGNIVKELESLSLDELIESKKKWRIISRFDSSFNPVSFEKIQMIIKVIDKLIKERK